MKSVLSSECSGMLDAQPATVYPARPDDPSRNSKVGFWSEHRCIYFLAIVLSTIVAVGMKFDLTCRQRNLSSTPALNLYSVVPNCIILSHLLFPVTQRSKVCPIRCDLWLKKKKPNIKWTTLGLPLDDHKRTAPATDYGKLQLGILYHYGSFLLSLG